MMLRLVPNIFYEKLSDGLEFFVTCLGFAVLYRDEQLAVVSSRRCQGLSRRER